MENEMVKSKTFLLSMEELEHERDVKIAICSVAILGLTTAAVLVRPFKRFVRPSDIPNRFITYRTKLSGTVKRIEPNGPLLMIQHDPVISIFPKKTKTLPVKISGVSINSNGVCWLQTIVAGENVCFIPMLKQKDCVQCEVTMKQKTKNNKENTLNIAANLIEIGFGTIDDQVYKSISDNSMHIKYYQSLKAAEISAAKRRLGYWYYIKKTQKTLIKLTTYALSLFNASKPKSTVEDCAGKVKQDQRRVHRESDKLRSA